MTSKKTLFCYVMVAAVLLAGCASKPKGKFTEEQMRNIPLAMNVNLPEASGGMTLGVYSETITTDEVLNAAESYLKPAAAQMKPEQFAKEALPTVRQAVQGKVTNILLYQEARKKAPDNIDEILDKAVEAEIARFVASYGNNYALAESKLKEMGMDWRSFRDEEKKMIMVQSYMSNTLKEEKRFSHQELVDYYEKNKNARFCKEGKVGFSIIEIRPNQLTPEQLGTDAPSQAAEHIAAEVISQLKDGANFAELAKQYHGALAGIGGKVTPVIIGANSLTEPYSSLAAQAVQMAPEQITGPIHLAEYLFILKLDLLEIGGCQTFEEVQNQIAHTLLFEYQRQRYQEFVNNLIRKANIVQMEQFVEFCVQQAYRRWGENNQTSGQS